jgi:glycosyltransferase involved in cell wall biosynthesis
VFVYPSIAEGVGLPVLEALACGAPVVTTTGSAPEEIAGDAALLVPPKDVRALRDAIAKVLADHELAATLRRRGPERARRFTWEATAAATVDVWRKAAATR